MTERKAWEYLAQRFADPACRKWTFVASGVAKGLCAAIDLMQWTKMVTPAVAERMFARIRRVQPNLAVYVWPVGDRVSRAEFCRKQAKRKAVKR